MKKFGLKHAVLAFAMTFGAAAVVFVPQNAIAYEFGDHRSETLVSKAWGALAEGDIEGVLAYTNKALELYASKAKEMQASMDGYATGSNEEIFQHWALNDVATSLFIQGEAYRRADMEEEAKKVFQKLVHEYSYGQTYDSNGWFWKPAEAAKEKLAMLDSGLMLDFGDYSSSFILGQSWRVLDKQPEVSVIYADKIIELYGDKAKLMQESLTEYPWQSREQVFNYWALNDVGTALYVKAEALKKTGNLVEAKEAYQNLVNNYFYAQCWDPQGWFWKPAEAAQQALDELGEV